LNATLEIAGGRPSSADRAVDREVPVPFEEVLLPFVIAARQSLEARDDGHFAELSDAAWTGLERGLLVSLSSSAARCLQLEFERFRALRQNAFTRVLAGATGSEGHGLYDAFVRYLLGGHLVEFLERYAMLARLLAHEVDCWVECTAELLRRLDTDMTELEEFFAGGKPLGAVDGIRTGLSDPHNGGRTVAVVSFSNGLRTIYKPRSVDMEAGWRRLMRWINDREPPLGLHTLDVLERKGYGWVGWVEHLPCSNTVETTRFYCRAGMLLCVLFVLSGRDVHFENIVAHGEQPVPVDLEALLHPEMKPEPGTEIPDPTLLDVGLLPFDFTGPRGETYDLSGLGHVAAQETSFQEPVWRSINTDAMTLELEDFTSHPAANAPMLNGNRLRPGEHVEDIVRGFREMHRFLVDHRSELLANDGPLSAFSRQRPRFIARPTQVYASVLKRALRPECLRDGTDFGIELDVLCRPLLSAHDTPRMWPLLRHEIRALERLDVPVFTASPDSDSLRLGPEETINACFEGSSYERVVKRLRELDDDDLERHIGVIRESLQTAPPDS
jgi:type 2 lantibiotic biosynthesis protein LanM